MNGSHGQRQAKAEGAARPGHFPILKWTKLIPKKKDPIEGMVLPMGGSLGVRTWKCLKVWALALHRWIDSNRLDHPGVMHVVNGIRRFLSKADQVAAHVLGTVSGADAAKIDCGFDRIIAHAAMRSPTDPSELVSLLDQLANKALADGCRQKQEGLCGLGQVGPGRRC